MTEAWRLARTWSQHTLFWTKERRSRFSTAAKVIVAAAELSHESLKHLATQTAGFSHLARSHSRLFGRRVSGIYDPRDPSALTAICAGLVGYASDPANGLDRSDPHVIALENLLDEFRTRYPDQTGYGGVPAGDGPAGPTEAVRSDPVDRADAAISVEPRGRIADPRAGGRLYAAAELERLLDDLPQQRERDNPQRPEFPINSPRFPATPECELKGFNCCLIVKDESFNPTGSHKDRWALEKVLRYRRHVEACWAEAVSSGERVRLEPMSMISGGSAAFALQSLLRHYGLPPLRVLMDRDRTDMRVVSKLEAGGAQVRLVDLDERFLQPHDVLELTHNGHGFDITTRDILTPDREDHYDWLCCEILLLKPRYIFLPIGTGALFASVLAVLARAFESPVLDPRLQGLTESDLTGIHVLGALPANPKTVMTKLFAPFGPALPSLEAELLRMTAAGIIGTWSAIIPIEDDSALGAADLARRRNIRTEPSGAAGLALFLEKRKSLGIKRTTRVLCINTGWLHLDHD